MLHNRRYFAGGIVVVRSLGLASYGFRPIDEADAWRWLWAGDEDVYGSGFVRRWRVAFGRRPRQRAGDQSGDREAVGDAAACKPRRSRPRACRGAEGLQ